MNIAMLTMEAFENRRLNSVGSSRIRGEWVMKYCKDIVPFSIGKVYDAVIYQKAYYLEHLKDAKGLKIFDICDPDWLEGRPIVELAEYVDAFTVPTEKMQSYLQQLTSKPVVLIPDRIDPDEHFPVKEIHTGKLRTVVWFGYSQNLKVLDKVVNVLQSRNIKLVIISNGRYPDADVHIDYDYRTVNQEIIKYDAVLMPPHEQDFRFTFKSNNKTLTAWALGMPVIREVDDLDRFADPAERKAEAALRSAEIQDKWHVRESGQQYIDLVKELGSLR